MVNWIRQAVIAIKHIYEQPYIILRRIKYAYEGKGLDC